MAEKNKKLRLRIVTPTKPVFDGDVDMVIMHTADGQIGVLLGHQPVTTIMGYGPLRVYNDEKVEHFAVFGGFAEIDQRGATVLADIAECPEEIDAERARKAKERAERRKSERKSDLDEKRLKLALRKATVRLELCGLPTITEESESLSDAAKK
ncbi:MAG: ATP synthase F1 subunit epsilon [Clostridiales bacterium]|jgi:F-type H+-transporting ATPase subunit epsilon|nr:ATP synthase F1 subunit epsilon [Clostridiales bacterium]